MSDKKVTGNLTLSSACGTVLEAVFLDIATAISAVTDAVVAQGTLALDIPPKPDMGDFAFRTFEYAKSVKKTPTEVATLLAAKLRSTAFVERWTATGPYLNIFLQREVVAKQLLEAIGKEGSAFGANLSAQDETIVLEYVQPNTNKPLHLGHLRNSLLALAVSRLLEGQGATVKKVNIVNDRGIHIVKSMLAYERWGNGETPESTSEKGDHFVGRYYVRFEQELAKEKTIWTAEHPSVSEDAFLDASQLMRDARDLLKRWEAGDIGVRTLWSTMNAWVLNGFAETYKAVGISFDKEYLESAIYQGGKEIILDGLARGVFAKTDDGAVIAPLSKTTNLPDKVLLRADGTSLYITQDLCLAKLRADDFHPTQSLYVVGSEQEMYFQQLFAVLRLLDFPSADKLVHLSYGLVFLPEGKMKSREGKVVDTDDLLLEMRTLTNTELAKRYPDLDEKERERRATAISLAAVKFHFLMVGRTSPVHFNPKESLSFEGKTGPYLQYSFARADSILRKAGDITVPGALPKVTDTEWLVFRSLLDFPRTLLESAALYDPARLANDLIELAQRFSSFYHDSPVLDAEPVVRTFRLALVKAFRAALQNGLTILGIETLEEM